MVGYRYGLKYLVWKLVFILAAWVSVNQLTTRPAGPQTTGEEHRGRKLLHQLLQDDDPLAAPQIDSTTTTTTTTTTTVHNLVPDDVFTDYQLEHGAFVLHALGVLYMFYALAIVCDSYFVASLDIFIEKYNITPDVAGATLMAAGGSAPELFTSFTGVFIVHSDVGIGTIVGSAVFNVLFVIAACTFAATTALQLTAWPLLRDTTFYSISLGLLVWFFADNTIEWWEALVLFVWYICYVSFMKVNEPAEQLFYRTFPSQLAKKGDITADGDRDKLTAGFKYSPARRPLLEMMRLKVGAAAQQPADLRPGGVATVAQVEMVNMNLGIRALRSQLSQASTTSNPTTLTRSEVAAAPSQEESEKDVTGAVGGSSSSSSSEGQVEVGPAAGEVNTAVVEVVSEEEEEEDFSGDVCRGPQGSLANKLVWCLTLPLLLLMWPIPNPGNPKRRPYFVLTFLLSILYVMVFSYLMVWWATVVCTAVGMSDTVMGLTFLAAGTSVPDLITSVLVAKQGRGDMAVSSSIGSNLFDVTVGLPVPWLLYTAIYQEDIKVSSEGMACNVGMLVIMLILVILSIMLFRWRMTKPMGVLMIFMYIGFVVFSIGLSESWYTCDFI